MNNLGSFTITINDSRAFARASGDYNPLHLDAVAARRTRFGRTLIHGVCGTLKALDMLCASQGVDTALLNLRVKFSRPAAQDQVLTVISANAGDSIRLEVFADATRCQIIEVTFSDAPCPAAVSDHPLPPASEIAESCHELIIESCKELSGEVDLVWDQRLMAELFPAAVRHLPAVQLAALLASTRIVGMRCPGLHSVFAQLEMRFPESAAGFDGHAVTPLNYKVVASDPRIDRVNLSLINNCVQGSVEAFFRPPPVKQASFGHLAALVPALEFSHQHALVIGGSRGLGEVITKALAAGGAQVAMTYAAGRDDALRVSQEIGQHRPAPAVIAYDVLDNSPDNALADYCASVTHIYYLASPTILKRDSGQWDSKLFARYCSVYIDGLALLLQRIAQIRGNDEDLTVFIPSSVFLEQAVKGFDEYIAAKAATEAFARCYQDSHRHCKMIAPRLPRLHTDQTAGVKTIGEQQTVEVIVDLLRFRFGKA